MGQKRSYKRYPKEFKEGAVALVRDQGYSVLEAAKSLGVASNLLYRWKDQQEQLSIGRLPGDLWCARLNGDVGACWESLPREVLWV